DGPVRPARREPAAGVERPQRARRGRLRRRPDRGVGRLHRREDPRLRDGGRPGRLVRRRLRADPRRERLHRGRRGGGPRRAGQGRPRARPERPARAGPVAADSGRVDPKGGFSGVTRRGYGGRVPQLLAFAADVLHVIRGILIVWLPIVLLVALLYFMYRAVAMMPRTKTKEIKPDSGSFVGWDDIAGLDEAKDGLREVVEVLRGPQPVRKLRRRLPAV